MDISPYRHIRRSKILPNDGKLEQNNYEENGNEKYVSLITTSSTIDVSSTIPDDPFDTTKTIGKEILNKIAISIQKSTLKENIRIT
ncbi:unnamed protein product [Rotaria sordida]|uniref:Uncharacterized protein n=1 Tax=Rotaria sordida TaxID=392033 RepID=A0A818NT49_9BILA|nr:unnamed protein product [Rotaria sordida]